MTVRRSAAARAGEADARLQALGQVLAAQAARDGGREGVVAARVAREDRPDVGADGVGHAGQDEVGQRREARLRRHRLAEGLRLRDPALLVLELADEGLELAALAVELAVLALEPRAARLELVVAVLERIGHGVEAAHHRAELGLRVVGPLHARVEVARARSAPRSPAVRRTGARIARTTYVANAANTRTDPTTPATPRIVAVRARSPARAAWADGGQPAVARAARRTGGGWRRRAACRRRR